MKYFAAITNLFVADTNPHLKHREPELGDQK
jgi:hypothetical protein